MSYSEKQKLWAAVGKAEQMDEAVAFFETRARENPDDPDAQFELGSAYVQKLLTVDDVRKLKWAQRADGSKRLAHFPVRAPVRERCAYVGS